jgi:hypothetical protein
MADHHPVNRVDRMAGRVDLLRVADRLEREDRDLPRQSH